jgi:hypothetical protein
MGRPRERPEVASIKVSFRATPEMVKWIDTQRGSLTRGLYLRTLVRQEAGRKDSR